MCQRVALKALPMKINPFLIPFFIFVFILSTHAEARPKRPPTTDIIIEDIVKQIREKAPPLSELNARYLAHLKKEFLPKLVPLETETGKLKATYARKFENPSAATEYHDRWYAIALNIHALNDLRFRYDNESGYVLKASTTFDASCLPALDTIIRNAVVAAGYGTADRVEAAIQVVGGEDSIIIYFRPVLSVTDGTRQAAHEFDDRIEAMRETLDSIALKKEDVARIVPYGQYIDQIVSAVSDLLDDPKTRTFLTEYGSWERQLASDLDALAPDANVHFFWEKDPSEIAFHWRNLYDFTNGVMRVDSNGERSRSVAERLKQAKADLERLEMVDDGSSSERQIWLPSVRLEVPWAGYSYESINGANFTDEAFQTFAIGEAEKRLKEKGVWNPNFTIHARNIRLGTNLMLIPDSWAKHMPESSQRNLMSYRVHPKSMSITPKEFDEFIAQLDHRACSAHNEHKSPEEIGRLLNGLQFAKQ